MSETGIYSSSKFEVWRPHDSKGGHMDERQAQRYEDEHGSRIGPNVFFIGGITNVPKKYFQKHIEFLMSRMNALRFGHGKNPALALLDIEVALNQVEGLERYRHAYENDQKAVEWADLVVCEATVPSTGTGQELERAVQSGKPIIMMARTSLDGEVVKPLHYFAEGKPKTGMGEGEIHPVTTLPSMVGISPMIRGNPNVVAVIGYDDEDQGLRDLTTVMENFFHDKHLSTRRRERLEEDTKIWKYLENHKSFEGIGIPDRIRGILEMPPEKAEKFMRREVAKDGKSLHASLNLFNFNFTLRHPQDVEADIKDSREPKFSMRRPPYAQDGEDLTHIRSTPYRPNYPPTLAERARREYIGEETVQKLEDLTRERIAQEQSYGKTYQRRNKKTRL